MMTSVAHEVDTRLKNTFGKLAYYVRGIGELPRFRPLDFTIEADGEIFQEKIFFFIVINSPVVASFKNIADAKIDDGKLVTSFDVADLKAMKDNKSLEDVFLSLTEDKPENGEVKFD